MNDANNLNGFVEPVATQPLDLSMKQSTPMSTDTGFSNTSYLGEVSPFRPSENQTNAWTERRTVYEKQITENGEKSRHDQNNHVTDLSNENDVMMSEPSTSFHL